MRKSPKSPPASFSSLPYEVVLNCLARNSRFYHPTLSLVSKSFRSLLASLELDATRTLIGKNEDYLYVCLNLHQKNNPKPCWFTLSPMPKQKLIPIPSFPYKHYPDSPAVVSIGSEIYVICGFIKNKRSRRVFVLNCRSHQWRRLPKMRTPRGKINVTVGLIEGKLYVDGGYRRGNVENFGEVYDSKTQTWESVSPTTVASSDLKILNSIVPLIRARGSKYFSVMNHEILCRVLATEKKSVEWCVVDENSGWNVVKGLQGLPDSLDLVLVANPGRGKRSTFWWCLDKEEEVAKTEIWCADILFERPSKEELVGILECPKVIYTFDRNESGESFSHLCSTIVTH